MLKNDSSNNGSSTILREINQELYKSAASVSTLGTESKSEYVTALENAVANMTVTSSGNHDGRIATAEDASDASKSDPSTSVTTSKELYQSMIEAARQLDSIVSKISTVEGLFGKEVLEQRRKLKASCEKLLFEDPKKYGVVARDRMWRSVFYDAICRAKRLKKTSTFTPIQQTFVKNHLLSGVGQLNVLVMKMQALPEFRRAKFRFVPNWSGNALEISCETLVNKLQEESADDETEADKWLLDVLYMCLINTGDLYRYLTDIFYKDADARAEYFDHAQHYYSEAFLLNPTSGLAHNQLGNLSLKVNDGLDSTYYLLYSMCTASAYDGAYPNLKQLLDGQLVHLATMPAVAELKPIDAFAHTFLGLIYHLVCTDGTHLSNFEKSCKEALVAFYDLLNSNDGKLEKQLYFRVAVITIMTVWRLHAIDSNYVSTAVAFASGIFLNLANYLSVIMKNKCNLAPKVPVQQIIEECTSKDELRLEDNGLDIPSADQISDTDRYLNENSNAKAEEKIKTKVGRRRRLRGRRIRTEDDLFSSNEEDENDNYNDSGSGSDDSDESSYESDSSEDETDSDLDKEPTEELNGNEYIYHEESVSSSNDYNSDGSSVQKASRPSDNENQDDTAAKKDQHLVLAVNDLLASIGDMEPVMIAMTPYIRWFKSSPLIVTAFISNCGNEFMQNICDIMNILGTVNWNPRGTPRMDRKPKAELLHCWQTLLKREDQDLVGTECGEILFELEEDRSMLGLPGFADDLKNLKPSGKLSFYDTALIRCERVLAFGHWLASVDGVTLKYSKEQNAFLVESAKNEKFYKQARRLKHLRDKVVDEDAYATDGSKNSWRKDRGFPQRNRDSEAHRLRRRPRRSRKNRTHDPNKHITDDDTVYIMCDLPAMLHYFDTIRRLAMYSKFAIVLPHSVHKTIDKLKDSEEENAKEARVAALWIEEQKERSAIRLLRRCDTLELEFEYPEPQLDAAREFVDVLKCCNYFRVQENKTGRPATAFFDDVRDKFRVLYLSGHLNLLKPKYRSEFNAREIAQMAHIFVDRVTFYVANQGRQIRKRRYKGKG